MMSFKLFTDTTKYQIALKKAFLSDSEIRGRFDFYQWAITLYTAFQRYSEPITMDASEEKPALLYYGSEQAFAMESALPFYNGIVSLTASIQTAHQLTKGKVHVISSSYSNK